MSIRWRRRGRRRARDKLDAKPYRRKPRLESLEAQVAPGSLLITWPLEDATDVVQAPVEQSVERLDYATTQAWEAPEDVSIRVPTDLEERLGKHVQVNHTRSQLQKLTALRRDQFQLSERAVVSNLATYLVDDLASQLDIDVQSPRDAAELNNEADDLLKDPPPPVGNGARGGGGGGGPSATGGAGPRGGHRATIPPAPQANGLPLLESSATASETNSTTTAMTVAENSTVSHDSNTTTDRPNDYIDDNTSSAAKSARPTGFNNNDAIGPAQTYSGFLAGDGNGDGVVAVADYTVWRDNFGRSAAGFAVLPGDYDLGGTVDDADYDVWQANFGRHAAAAGSQARIHVGFDDDLSEWDVRQQGGSFSGGGTVEVEGTDAVMREGDSFLVTLAHTFEVPEDPAIVRFTYDAGFDTSDTDFVNDAFEAALVDDQGNTLVLPFVPDRDAYFNLTEEELAAFGPGVSTDGQTVTLDISSLFAGTTATIMFRLVNNDDDTETTVRIRDVEVPGVIRELIPVAQRDDGDWGYIERGIWTSSNTGWQDDTRSHPPGNGTDLADWVIILPGAGLFEIYTTWEANPTGATNAPFHVIDGAKELAVVTVDQTVSPADGTYDGRMWHLLGTYDITTAVPTIRISDDADGQLLADGVIFVPAVDGTSRGAARLVSENQSTVVTAADLSHHPFDVSQFASPPASFLDEEPPIGLGSLATLSLAEPKDRQRFTVGDDLLLHGQVASDGAVTINVTVNGTSVDALDASGKFFHSVQIAPGLNAFQVASFDASGQTASQTVTVMGVATVDNIDFSLLFDVSDSFEAAYARTSFDQTTDSLYANLAIRNVGQFPADNPFLVGIDRISEPTVRVRDASGLSPDGIPFYNFSEVVPDDTLSPSDITGFVSAAFFNPRTVHFTYDLVFLAKLNEAPRISSAPHVTAIADRPYTYDVKASDVDADPLTFSLLVRPAEMTIDEASGQIRWSPTAADVGRHNVQVRVDDGRGGSDVQQYTLSVLDDVENRPPRFTSSPVVIASVGGDYAYQATADDPDRDPLIFTLQSGPLGMAIDRDTGQLSWTPTANQLGLQRAEIQVNDGRGGVATQVFDVNVLIEDGNRPPVIVSDPVTRLDIPPPGNAARGDVNPAEIVRELGFNEMVTETVSLKLEPLPTAPPNVITTPLELGETINGQIDSVRESDVYAFTVDRPTFAYFDSLTNDDAVRYDLRGPTGPVQRNFNATDALNNPNVVLRLQPGDYTLTVFGQTNETPAYSFRLLDLADAVSINLGEEISGELTPNNSTDMYRFEGTAGDILFLNELVNSSERVRLLDPNGQSVLTTSFGDHDRISLFQDGTYTFLIEGRINGASPAAYGFAFSSTQPETIPLTLGQPLFDDLAPGEFELLTFSITERTLVFIDGLVAGNQARYLLTGPNGGTLINSTNPDNRFVLNPGDYTIEVDNNNDVGVALYGITVIPADQAIGIALDTQLDVSLSPAVESQLFNFTGTAGQTLFFDHLSETGIGARFVIWRLVDPTGTQLFSSRSDFDQEITLPHDGLYTLEVAGQYISTLNNATSDLTFNVRTINDDQLALTINGPTSGTIDAPGAKDIYTFNVPTRQLFYFDSLTGNGNFNWTLDGPAGRQINERQFTASDANAELAVLDLRAGEYTLTIDGRDDEAGNYTFQLRNLAGATPIAFDTLISGQLDQPISTDLFQFNANAGDTLLFDSQTTESISMWRLIGPLGNVIFGAGAQSDQGPVTINTTGTHTLAIEGRIFENVADDYAFELQFQGNTPPTLPVGDPLTIGATVNASIEVAGEEDNYLFTLANDALLYFDSLTDTADITYTLTGPRGVVINSLPFRTDESLRPLVDLRQGDYVLTINGRADNLGNYSFRMLSLADAVPLTVGTPVADTLNPAHGTNMYGFDATAGDLLVFHNQALEGTSTIWRLFGPGGNQLFRFQAFVDVAPLELPVTGTYTVLIEGSRLDQGQPPRDYTFEVRPFAFTTQPLNLNQRTIGTSDVFGDVDTYTFSVSDPTIVYFDTINAARLNYRLTGPLIDTGDLGAFRDHLMSLRRLVPGDYTLTLSSADFASNFTPQPYEFELIDITAAVPLTLGETTETILSPANATAMFQFDGSAGDQITFVPGPASPGGVEARIVYPSGASPDVSLTTASDLILPFDGTYTILIEGRGGTSFDKPVSFTIFPNFTSAPQQIAFNTVANDEISVVGEEDQYTLSVVEPVDVVFDSLTRESFLTWTLEGLGGKLVDARRFSQSESPEIDPQQLVMHLDPGDYALTVDGVTNTTGAYGFQMLDLASATPITADGSTISGTLAPPPNTTDLYRFDAVAGEKLNVDVRTVSTDNLANSGARVIVVDPFGRVIIDRRLFVGSPQVTPKLGATGTYTILVQDALGETVTKSYEVFVDRVPRAEQLFQFGDVLTAIGLSRIVHYRKDGTLVQVLDTGIDGITAGMVFDDAGQLFVTNFSQNSVSRFDLFGDITFPNPYLVGTSSDLAPESIALNNQGEFYVGHATRGQGGGNRDVVKFSPEGTLLARFDVATSDRGSDWIDLAADQKTLLYTSEGREIFLFDLEDNVQLPNFVDQVEGGRGPFVLFANRILPDGGLLVADRMDIKRFDADRNIVQTYDVIDRDENAWFALNLDPDGTSFWSGDQRSGHLYKFDIETGEVHLFIDTRAPLGGGNEFAGVTVFGERRASQAIELIASDAGAPFENLTGVVTHASPGSTISSDAKFTGDALTHQFDLQFVAVGSGNVLGSIPVTLDSSYFYLVQALDPDDDELTFSLPIAPPDASIDPQTGRIRFLPDGPGAFDFQVRVEDGRGGVDTQDYTVFVTRGAPNSAPVVNSAPPDTAAAGFPYEYQVDAFDPDGDILFHGLSEFPAGMTIDRDTGLVTYTPNLGQVGTQVVTVLVSDRRGGQAVQEFDLNVVADLENRGPQIVSDPIVTARVGHTYTYDVEATDPDADPLTFELPGAPSGMTIDPQTGVIVWDPQAGQIGDQRVVVRVRDGRGGLTLQVFDVRTQGDNAIPVIVSDPVTTATANTLYRYQVVAIDAEDDPLTFALDQAPAGMTIDPDTGLVTFVATSVQVGDTPVVVSVTDGISGGRDRQTFAQSISAGPANDPPQITSTPTGPARVGFLYRYDVEAVDPNGDPITFSLSTAPPGMTIDSISGMVTWTPEASQLGDNEFLVVASDGRGGRATQRVTLSTVLDADAPNDPPLIRSTPTGPAVIGLPYEYEVEALDPNGDAIRYRLDVAPNGLQVVADTGLITWTPEVGQVGDHDVALVAADDRGGEAIQSFILLVTNDPTDNIAPQISSTPPAPAVVGRPYQYQMLANDSDGDPLTFQLEEAPAGMTIDQNTGLVSFVADASQVGMPDVQIRVDDGRGGPVIQRFNLPIVGDVINNAPVITSTARAEIRFGRSYTYQIEASDSDGDPLLYGLDQAPGGMTVDAKGFLTWTPTANQMGQNQVSVRVSDGRGGDTTQEFAIDVTHVMALANNDPPQITSSPPRSAVVAELFRYHVVAEDPENDPVFFMLEEAPSGMSIDANSGAVRWRPTADQIGPQLVEIRVLDAQGGAAMQRFEVAVAAVNLPPNITSTPATQAVVDQPYVYDVDVIDPERDRLAFSLDVFPDGMAIDDQTGFVQWSPTAAQLGTNAVQIRVTEDGRRAVIQGFDVMVLAAPPNRSPSITSTPPVSADVQQIYTYQVTATDPEGDPLSFALARMPQGMTIDQQTGLVEWTPRADQVGVTTVEVVATDPAGSSSRQNYTMQVRSNAAPVILSEPRTSAVPATLYGYDVFAFDPDGDAVTYRLTQAPSGMTIDAFGRIMFVPQDTDLGVIPVEVMVTDAFGATATQMYELTVAADSQPPQVIVNLSDNGVDLDTEVTFTVQAVDNVAVVELGLAVGGQPLALDGSGRAKLRKDEVGEFTVVATATDAAGNVGIDDTQTLVVLDLSDVDAPVISITSPAPGAIITAPTDIVGTVSDDNLLFYTLEVRPVDSPTFTEVFRSENSVADDVLATFDPTMLRNDSYVVRLRAVDAGGNEIINEFDVSVTEDLKLGNFTLSFEDLSIDLIGIPITVTRTYDTLHADDRNDFGFGWKLNILNTDLSTSVPSTGFEQFGVFNAFNPGTRVYVTNPNGKREAFTFQPDRFGLISLRPNFVPDPGVTSTLSVEPFDLAFIQEPGEFRDFFGSFPYNPSSDLFGGTYTLTTSEGFVVKIDGLSGNLMTITDRNANTLTFQSFGISSSTGARITFQRDPQGRITSVIDQKDQQINYEYDANGDLVAVTDRENNQTHFVYNAERSHFLEEVIDPFGRTGARSEYDEQGRFVRLLDVNGNKVEVVHDRNTFSSTVGDALGNVSILEYDTRGNVVGEIDAEGGRIRRTYDREDNLLTETVFIEEGTQLTKSLTYDARGKLSSMTDALGNTYYFDMNSFGDLLNLSDPLGNVTQFNYDKRGNMLSTTDAEGDTIRFTYDDRGNVLSEIDAEGNVAATHTYDATGNETSISDSDGYTRTFVYDANGNVTSTSIIYVDTYDNADQREVATNRFYDGNDRTVRVTGPDGNEALKIYNEGGQLVQETDSFGISTVFVYDNRGLLIETQSSDGTLTRRVYDELGREVYLTAPFVPSQLTNLPDGTHTIYDKVGRVIATEYVTDLEIDIITLDDGSGASILVSAGVVLSTTANVYDAAGRLAEYTGPRGETTKYEHDLAGRRTAVVDASGRRELEYDALGRVILERDELGNATRFEYDAVGRRVKTIFPDGTFTAIDYDAQGRVVSVTDQTGTRREFEYDLRHRLTGVQLSALADAGDINVVSPRYEYEYDIYGNLRLIRDAQGMETHFKYDELTRPVARTLPLGQTEHLEYDALGRRSRLIDFNGQVTEFIYDEFDRLSETRLYTNESNADLGVPQTVIRHTYDELGRQDTIEDPRRGQASFHYDVDDNVTQITTPEGVIQYEYDRSTGSLERAFTDYSDIRYTYDNLGRLKTVAAHELNDAVLTNPLVWTYDYDAVGRRESIVYPNGVATAYTYDDLNRLIEVTHTDSKAQLQSSYQYVLDADGRYLSLFQTRREDDNQLSQTQINYRYDALKRLIHEETIDLTGTRPDTNSTVDYVYDLVGNRLSKTTTTASGTNTISYTYNENDQLLSENSTDGTIITYAYDANGSLVEKQVNGVITATYAYTIQNRLETATLFSTADDGQLTATTTTYAYDENGFRVRTDTEVRIDGGLPQRSSRLFLNDPHSFTEFAQAFEERDGDGIPHVTYIIGDDVLSQHVVEQTGDTHHLLYDGQGSTRLLVNQDEHIIGRMDYDGYGAAVNVDPSTTPTRLLYSGEYYDSTTQQYYLRARYYDPSTGRFNRIDPSNGDFYHPQSLHKYSYARADPINLRDPTGRFGAVSVSVSASIASSIQNAYNGTVLLVGHALETTIRGVEAGQSAGGILLQFGIGVLFEGVPLFGRVVARAGKGLIGPATRSVGRLTEPVAHRTALLYIRAFTKQAQKFPLAASLRYPGRLIEEIPRGPRYAEIADGFSSGRLKDNLLRELDLLNPINSRFRDLAEREFAAHHIIPLEMRTHPVITRIRMDLDDATNGIFLNKFLHHTHNHSGYRKAIKAHLNRINDAAAGLVGPKKENFLLQQVTALQEVLANDLWKGAALEVVDGGTEQVWDDYLQKVLPLSF